MKLAAMSDLHLEFGDLELPGGDILVLAGDIWTVYPMSTDKLSEKQMELKSRYIRFCREELSKYKEVIVIMGNHEHYGLCIDETPVILRRFLGEHAKNAILLDNSLHKTHNILFMGTTLWASYGCPRPEQEQIAKNLLSDCKLIYKIDVNSPDYRSLMTPRDFDKLHRKCKHWVYTASRLNPRSVKVLVTHHAPSWESHDGGRPRPTDWAYYSSMDRLFQKKHQVVMAIHGHTHRNVAYVKGLTVVGTNQRGYVGHETAADEFDPKAGEIDIRKLFLKLKAGGDYDVDK